MKKLFAILICAIMCITFLAACNSEEHEHTGEWHTSESTHYYQYTCGCPSPDIAELHSDYDENFICDICGYVMPEHEHTYEYNHDDIGHGWSYTCGCMTPPNFAQHFDGDGDGKCDEDSCGYDMSEIPTPTNHFLRNQAGCEWLNEITADDIVELKMTHEYEGVGPGTMRYVFNSTLTEPISRIFEEYFNMGVTLVSRDEAIVPGGSNMIVEFILKDGTKKEFIFYDGCYHDVGNDRYYRLDYRPTFNDVPEYTSYCQFVTIGEWDKCEIWYDDPTEPYFVCDIPLEELKFNVYNGNIGTGVSEYPYFIETDFGRLGFVSNDVFFIVGDGTYYQLVGKNLDEIIAYATNPNYSALVDAYLEKAPEADYVNVVHYYGKFDSGAIVAMMTCSEYDYTEALWDELIDDVTIHYNNGNRILVLYEGEFYNLTIAYEKGYITKDDLIAIRDLHNDFCKISF